MIHLDVEEILSHDRRTLVDGLSGAVEHPTQHILGNRGSKNVAGEFAGGFFGVDSVGSLEDLNHGLGTGDLEHLTGAKSAVGQLEVDDLGESGELDLIEDDERPVHARDGSVGDSRLRDVVTGQGHRLVNETLSHRNCGRGHFLFCLMK